MATLERFRAVSREKPFVLFLFDLDRFKQVNDSLGHAAGDAYLIETADRVRSILRPGDSLARMGGDEFVALFEGVGSEAGARSIASRIIDAVSQPYTCHGSLLHPKTSIGIVLCDGPAGQRTRARGIGLRGHELRLKGWGDSEGPKSRLAAYSRVAESRRR